MEQTDIEKIEKRSQHVIKEINEELERIANLGAGLNDSDKAFIRARVSYLSPSQKELWSEVLTVEPSDAEGEPSEPNMSYKDLQSRAAELGIKAVGVSKSKLEKLVAEAEEANA